MNAAIRPLAGITGASTDTEFFERTDMMDTKVGAGSKMDAGEVARIGFKAIMDGDGDVVAG